MIISAIKDDNTLWDSVIEYAQHCSWRAGPVLAKNMREGHFSDWERVFVAQDNKNKLAGYCTLAKTDCIPALTYTPYIGYMFVGEQYRGRRLSQKLIQSALKYAKKLRFSKVYLVSGEKGLYEKYGFTKIEEKKNLHGQNEQIFVISI
ncbi:GNAT family N-acetyltransferase [Pectinatus frisingensis]|jgi:predicted N-acetyltransferase YhbS|uniref:GNAT family N-acetyltransferase n=1 Tax=Pectinatus frisingensis TaxID=865 RepID=UPI0018C630ED|nr:GNAT family N-acetyltransferase [Pectinatus frisingensis]